MESLSGDALPSVEIPNQRVPVRADQVVLSWAEVDPEFGACTALLATRYNGVLLTRPTLVPARVAWCGSSPGRAPSDSRRSTRR